MTRIMSTLQALLWGGSIGYVAGLLTAKKPGAELRQELSETSASFCKECGESISKLKADASCQVQAITNESSTVNQNLRKAIGQLSEKAAGMKDTMADTAQKLQVQTKDMKDTMTDTAQKLHVQGKDMKDTLAEQTAVVKESVVEEMNKARAAGGGSVTPGPSTGSAYGGQKTFDVSPGSSQSRQ
ncbi:MAG: hypothetical protein K2W95_06705 [Candidatus Obscuribacterales bacterium]|nr:hypothetical protein [Candidatus Obscuribacterales bacterium]